MLLITFYEILLRMCRIQQTLTVGNVGPFLHDECVTWQALQESGSNAREFDFFCLTATAATWRLLIITNNRRIFGKLLKAIINVI